MARKYRSPTIAAASAISITLLLGLPGTGSSAWAGEPVTEDAVVRAALNFGAARDLRNARLDAAAAARSRAGRWANPEFGWNRESLDAADSTETQYYLRQEIPLGGKARLARTAAGKRYEAAEQELRGAQVERAALARRAFSEALFRDGIADVHRRWAEGLEHAGQSVAELAKAGEASRYDAERIGRAVANAQSLSAATQAERMYGRERLVSLTGDTSLRTAALSPKQTTALPPLDAYLARISDDPRLRAVAAEAEAAETESERAGRRWIPDVAVTAGEKQLSESGKSESGLVLGVSIPLPLFDTGSAERRELSSHARALRSQHSLLLAEQEADLRGTWQLASALERAASSAPALESLGHVATAAYQAGEGSVLELIDAYDAERETAVVSLELTLRARLARVELDALVGEMP